MKRILVPILLCLALAAGLCACAGTAPEAPAPASPAASPDVPPSVSISPPPSLPPAEEAPTPPVTLQPALPAEPDNARYFFAEGCFLGSWDGGVWHSAADGGFTMGQLFNRSYTDVFDRQPGTVRFYAGEGPGGLDDPETAQRLLKPFGVLEGGSFIMYLPGQLTGEAAEIPIPDYGFYADFDGQTHYLISNDPIQPLSLTEAAYFQDEEGTDGLLRELGISCELRRCLRNAYTLDMDGDGEEEYLEFIRNSRDSNGFLSLSEGDSIFYTLLLTDGGETSVIALQCMDYTEDSVAHFSPGAPIIADLDGDDQCEVIIRHGEWEWGHYSVFSRSSGQWTEVLRANYGT